MEFIYLLPGAFFAPILHEWVKAIVSTLQGDPTPRDKGFLTGNPLKFFEPVGFFLMLLRGVGWGQPVPTASLHYKNRRQGTLITYITPSVVNLVIGMLTIALVSLMAGVSVEAFVVVRQAHMNQLGDIHFMMMMFLFAFAQCNVWLALFNLIPVHPLDSSVILRMFAKPDTLVKLNHYEKPMQIILMLALVLGVVHMLFNPLWITILRMAWLV